MKDETKRKKYNLFSNFIVIKLLFLKFFCEARYFSYTKNSLSPTNIHTHTHTHKRTHTHTHLISALKRPIVCLEPHKPFMMRLIGN